jgi:hypothetical protein
VSEQQPPWEVNGIPFGLGVEVFSAAADAWVLHVPQMSGPHRIRPALGVWGSHASCAGNHFPENQARTRRLLERPPMFETSAGGRTYPAIFAPDPTVADNVPLAIITAEGYIGSAWGALATEFVPRVLRNFRPDIRGGRELHATVVHISSNPVPSVSEYHVVQVWVPRQSDADSGM